MADPTPAPSVKGKKLILKRLGATDDELKDIDNSADADEMYKWLMDQHNKKLEADAKAAVTDPVEQMKANAAKVGEQLSKDAAKDNGTSTGDDELKFNADNLDITMLQPAQLFTSDARVLMYFDEKLNTWRMF